MESCLIVAECSSVSTSELLCLVDEFSAVAKGAQSGYLIGERLVLLGGGDGILALVSGRGIAFVFLHIGLSRRQFLLNPGALISGGTREVFEGVVEFVLIESELSLCDFKVVRIRRGVAVLNRCGEGCDMCLIVPNRLLELVDLLLQLERVPGELGLFKARLTERLREGLIDLVVGEPLRLKGEFPFFAGPRHGRESCCGLPWALIDDAVRDVISRPVALFSLEKRKVFHNAASEEDAGRSDRQHDQQDCDRNFACPIHGRVLFGEELNLV